MADVVSDHQDFPPGLPDDLKMPERAVHRQAVDLIALAAIRLLGSTVHVFRDMNWYPADGGNATAPDIMVLPVDAVERLPRSYHQHDGPAPLVVVEIPSDGDSFAAMRAKARRAQALGTTVYVVVLDGPDPVVLRLGPDDSEFIFWTGNPIPDLGGLRLDFVDGDLELVLPDGQHSRSDADLLVRAETRAAQAETRATQAEARADSMAAMLRDNGIDPPDQV